MSTPPSDQDERRRFFRKRWEAHQEPVASVWQARRRLAAVMRRVIEGLITSDAPAEELGIAADRLEGYAKRLEGHPRRERYDGYAESALAEGGGHFDYSPLIGGSNPLAPPIQMHSEEERVYGEVVFGSAYEGPPGKVHGGYVAAAFDEVLGYAQSLTGAPGMTGTLTTIYRVPTPLHTPLRFEAWVERVDGRKIHAASTLHAGDMLCAEATGIFISMRPGGYEKLMEERSTGEGS